MVGSVTKDQLIDLLSFPRQLVQEELADISEDCPHELRFACEDTQCLICDLEDECRWLSENDEFSPLHLRSIPRLLSALDAAIIYVRGDAIAWGHAAYCLCQICEWQKKAQQMYDSLDLTEVLVNVPPGDLSDCPDKGYIDHRLQPGRPKPSKASIRFGNFWCLQSVKNSITRFTNMRIHLLRTFHTK